MISNEDKAYLLSLTPDDLTFTCLVSLFGDTRDDETSNKQLTHSRFNTTDEMILLPSEYFVTERTKTTVGRFIFNKYLVERFNFQKILGYVNAPVTNGYYGSMEAKLAKALVDDVITIETFHSYINYRDTLGMQLNSVITTSFTPKSVVLPKEVEKKKEALFKKYDKELNNGDIILAEKIEKELLADSKAALRGDPGADLYDSGARGGYPNYKNMNIMKGATKNNVTGKYEIVRSSFMDGIRKEDIASFGTSIVSGAYPKAVGTQDSGYMAKEILACMQTESLNPDPESDCGSTKTIEVIITEKNQSDYSYRYIVEGKKLVKLDTATLPKYIGKTVQMRTPMYCKDDKICSRCAGELCYRLNNINVGLQCSRIANTLLKLGMKKFHIASMASSVIDPDDMLI